MSDGFLKLKEHFEAFSQKQDGAVKDFSRFLEQISPKYKKMADARKDLRKKYGLDDKYDFNILKEIRDDWDEPFHSKLLRKILDPKQLVIGGKENLKQFFKLIGLSDDEISEWNLDEVFVETEVTEKKLAERLENDYKSDEAETGRIDILICDKNNCVIIENKLKDASNQRNQLQRYVRITQNQELKIQKIVYIPPIEREISKDCDKEYRKEQKQIEESKWLVVVPAVRSNADKGKKKSLVQDFFPSICGELSEENKTRLVFFDQYEKILAKLGEDEIMKGIEKELVALLCGTKESQKRTNDLLELLQDDKGNKLRKLKAELLLEKINKDYGLEFIMIDDGEYGKKLQCPEEVEVDVYFYFNPWGYGIESKNCTKKVFNGLRDKIKSIPNISELTKDDGWFYYYCDDYNFDDLSIENLAPMVKERYEQFKKAVKK